VCAAFALCASTVGTASTARAQRSAESGPELALRTGLALPFGDVDGGADNHLDRYAGSAIPLVLEVGYRVDPTLFFGARFDYSFPQLKNPAVGGNCDNTSCDGSGVRLGLEGIYRFLPADRFAPWVGLGAGYEWMTADYFGPNGGAGATVRGFHGLIQAGGDVRVGPQLVLGPFVELSMGRFDSATTRVRIGNLTTETDDDITDTAWHSWLALGLRGAFGF
jgi:hypothetical protein